MEPSQLEIHRKTMRAQAQRDYVGRVPFDSIVSDSHREVLEQAIRNVLSTELALFTYAQIIDGLPTADVAWDRRFPGIFGNHIIDDHEDLCPGTMDKARELYNNWSPASLNFSPKAIELYQRSDTGTPTSNIHLIELVAVALHQIGVAVYKLDLRLHQGDIQKVEQWTMPLPISDMIPIPPRSTLFNHPSYLDEDVYPEGKADVVGYWVEDRILGGVAVLDRRTEEPSNIYFHSCRDRVTHRLCQLTDNQQESLIKFLLDKTPTPPPLSCPLPIVPDRQNRVRVDAHSAIFGHKIYRDIWERMPITKEEARFLAKRPQDEIDYPELRDAVFRINQQLSGRGPAIRPRTPSPDYSNCSRKA